MVFSEEVDDLILGIDWLSRHRCRWSFVQNLIETDGKVVRMISRPRRRRIYAVESTEHGHSSWPHNHVSVTMVLSSLGQMLDDWAVAPRSLGTGILAARTLMRDKGHRSAVQVINVNETDFVLSHGVYIDEAEQVTTVNNEERTS